MRAGIPVLLAAALVSGAASGAPFDDVDVFIGTGGVGHLYPGPKWPNGMVSPGPDTGVGNWSYCAGYQYRDTRVRGFSQIHSSGMGAAEFMDVLLQPFTGDPSDLDLWGLQDKRRERGEPGYYSCVLTNFGVRAELTASRRVAYHRYAFDRGNAHVLVDLAWGGRAWGGKWADPTRPRTLSCKPEVSPDGLWVTGCNVTEAFVKKEISYAVLFSRRPTGWRLLPARPGDGDGKRYVFDFDLKPGETLLVKAALSSVDPAAAKANLLADPEGFDFDARRADCAAAWRNVLSRAVVEADGRVRKLFATALYHSFLEPSLFCDADGRYRGADGKVHVSRGWEKHSLFSLWDTFRAQCPLFTVLMPEKVNDLVLSLVTEFDEIGRVPKHQTWGLETYCMVGDHSVPFIVDAILKGLAPGVDPKKAYAAIDRTLRSRTGRYRDFDYDAVGYFPIGSHGSPCSHSLEHELDDACAAMLARHLGDAAGEAFYAKRAKYYTKLYDAASGCFRARYEDGRWREPFDPLHYGAGGSNPNFDYTESCAYNYAFHLMHDPEGLVALHGGKEKFFAFLDGLFRQDAQWKTRKRDGDCTGLIGEFAMGNEPQHHIPYFFQYAGRGDRTAEVVREICDRLYTTEPTGICGNDDCGQMSAWYVFSAMGFYPFMPCGGDYVLGAPQVARAVVKVRGGEGKTFTIVANGLSKENKHVKAVTLNGKPLDGFVLRHKDIAAGGDLAFRMGP